MDLMNQVQCEVSSTALIGILNTNECAESVVNVEQAGVDLFLALALIGCYNIIYSIVSKQHLVVWPYLNVIKLVERI